MRLKRAIASFLEGYFSTCRRSPKTVQAYRLDLEQFRDFVGSGVLLRSIDPDVLEEWAAELRDAEYASSSIRRKFASLKVFFSYWVRRGAIERSPAWQLRLDLAPEEKLPSVLSLDEVQQLLSQARRELGPFPKKLSRSPDQTFLALRNLAIVEILFATGIRVGELISLRVDDIDESRRQFLINGKGSRQRLARLLDDRSHRAVATYRSHRIHLAAETDALFINLFGGALSNEAPPQTDERVRFSLRSELEEAQQAPREHGCRSTSPVHQRQTLAAWRSGASPPLIPTQKTKDILGRRRAQGTGP